MSSTRIRTWTLVCVTQLFFHRSGRVITWFASKIRCWVVAQSISKTPAGLTGFATLRPRSPLSPVAVNYHKVTNLCTNSRTIFSTKIKPGHWTWAHVWTSTSGPVTNMNYSQQQRPPSYCRYCKRRVSMC